MNKQVEAEIQRKLDRKWLVQIEEDFNFSSKSTYSLSDGAKDLKYEPTCPP